MRFLYSLSLGVIFGAASCGGGASPNAQDAGLMDASADAGTTDAMVGPIDAGTCSPGVAPFQCRQACGSDIMAQAECIQSMWQCSNGYFRADAYDTMCIGKLVGPCGPGNTCDAGLVCGRNDRCLQVCPDQMGATPCHTGTAMCCDAATEPALCIVLGDPTNSICPINTIPENECVAVAPGC